MTSESINAYGISQGTFEVDASGQATYCLPIFTPPGIAGGYPKLDIIYSHRQSNGILGVGWGLSGLSAITRLGATMALDRFIGGINYDKFDRLALDGQRLINIDGDYWEPNTIYYTEIHNWKKIVAGNAPQDGFIVYMKNGEKWEYGTKQDSCISVYDPTNNSTSIRAWALTSIEDLNGNRIEYTYTNTPIICSDNIGAYYISKISYTAREGLTASRTIDFGYESRPDEMVTYLGGYKIGTSYRLNTITVSLTSPKGDPETICTYSLTYQSSPTTQLSCLNAIIVTGTDGMALPDIQVTWQGTAQPAFDTSQPTSPLLNTQGFPQTLPMDINGDGLTDIVQFYSGENNIYAITFLAGIQDGQVKYAQSQKLTLGAYSGSSPENYQILAADVNGDGLTDLVIVYPNEGNLNIDVYLSNGAGFNKDVITTTTTDTWQETNSIGFYAIDVNGDGCTDLVQAFSNGSSGANLLNFNVYLSSFNGGNSSFPVSATNISTQYVAPTHPEDLWAIDVNGDSMVDMVLLWKQDQILHTTSFITTSSVKNGLNIFGVQVDSNLNASTTDQVTILPADVNGDGIIDILQIYQSSGNSPTIQVYFSNAMGCFVPGPVSSFPNQTINQNSTYPMGFNGGAQTSLLSCWLDTTNNLNFTVFNSSPSGMFSVGPSIDTGEPFSSLNFFVGDANGDGKADLFYMYTDSSGNMQVQPLLSEGPYPDLVSTITDQLGGQVAISYAPLSDPTVYAPEAQTQQQYPKTTALRYPNHLSPAQFPVQEVLGRAIYVVSGYTLSNDSSLNRFPYSHACQMQYANARIDLTGRGWEGFEIVSKLDVNIGLRTIQTYLQDFPFTGALASVRTEADGTISNDPKVSKSNSHVLLGLSLNTYQKVRHPGAETNSQVFEIQSTGNLGYVYDYGNFDYLLAKSFGYDDYGNRNTDTWYGYIGYRDPNKITVTDPFPTVAPNNPDEVVYTYRQFQNDLPAGNGWFLGYLTNEKESANASDADISSFQPGDYNLVARTYNPSTYTLATQAHWDDSNACFLTTNFTYDEYGNRLTETKPGGFITTLEYETAYNTYPSKVTSPPNDQNISLVTYEGYDPRFGILVAHQDANGNISVIGLDGFGRKICKQGPVPAGCDQSNSNAVTSLVTGAVAFASATVLTLESMTYSNDGAGGVYTQHSTLQFFPVDSSRDFASKWKYVDGLGREREFVVESGQTAGNSVVLTDYDPCGKPSSKSLPFFAADPANPVAALSVTYTYDVLGRPVSVKHPAGADGSDSTTDIWEYDAGGVVTITQAASTTLPVAAQAPYIQIITNHFYHGKHRQTQSVIHDDNQATTFFVFDALGRLLQTTDPAGVANNITYDSLDRKLTYDNPDQNTTGNISVKAVSYTYDATTGRAKTVTDAANAATSYEYDELGRITSKTFTDGRVFQFSYDDKTINALGRLSSVNILAADQMLESKRDFAYDVYGNPVSETLTIIGEQAPFTTSSVFDPQGRLVGQTYPDNSQLTRAYQFGLLTSQTLDGATTVYPLEAFTPFGSFGEIQLSSTGGAPALDSVYTYNPAGLPYTETLQNGSQAPLLNFSYTFDALNQLTGVSENINNRVEGFSYVNKRLATASVPGFEPGNGIYSYDTAGNILSKDGNTYTNQAHFPTSIKTSTNETYSATQDACGRTLARTRNGTTLNFIYDGMGCVKNIANETGTLRAILSDDQGQRIKETLGDGTVIVYISTAYQVQTDANGTTITKYLIDPFGPTASITYRGAGSKTILFFRRDHKGNVTHTFDVNGNPQSVIAYDGYGLSKVLNGPDGNLPKYEHKLWDAEIGLYYFGARYYDPFTGRFLTPDSRLGGQSPLQADVCNRFAFELNNPVNHVDPSGHMANWVKGLLIGIGAAVAVIGIVATGGLATPIVAAGLMTAAAAAASTALAVGTSIVVGALLGFGASAIAYSLTHIKGGFSWKEYGINAGIGAAAGTLGGGLSAYAGAGIAASSFSAVGKFAANSAVSVILGGSLDIISTAVTNAATGQEISEGLLWAFIFGVTFGMIGAFGEIILSSKARTLESAVTDLRQAPYRIDIQPADVEMPTTESALDAARRVFKENLWTSIGKAKRFERIANSSRAAFTLAAIPQAFLESTSSGWGR